MNIFSSNHRIPALPPQQPPHFLAYHGLPTAQLPATHTPTTRHDATTTRRRSRKTRNDSRTIQEQATRAIRGRSEKRGHITRTVSCKDQGKSRGRLPKKVGNAATASGTTGFWAAAGTGRARATGPYYAWGAGSEGAGTGEVVEGAGFEDTDLYIEWAAEGYVQRYAIPQIFKTPFSSISN